MSSCKWQMNSYPTALFCWTMYSHSVKLPVEFNGTPQSPCTRVIAHANQCLLTQSSPSSLFLLEYPLVSPCFLSECTEEYCTGDKMQESLKKKEGSCKKWILDKHWMQNSILHNQSQRCENLFDMQTGKTDGNKWEQGAVWGCRVENLCCLFPTCTVP